MQVQDPNEVKIYNLSAGKSLPEWLTDRKRRKLVQKDGDIRRRIELLQDFEMPGLSTCVRVTRDGQYVLATGIYKPRVRCYEFANLSMKFERCFDSEVVGMEMLSEDYGKVAFLQNDRYVELHGAGGRYFRLRVPRYGRDIKYLWESCDLVVGGVGGLVYRLNLERGQFLAPWETGGSEVTKMAVNPCHRLLAVGTKEGKVEGWDPRARSRVGLLDVGLNCLDSGVEGLPSITSLEFNGGLTLGVGTSTGLIHVYDLRSNKPSITKDHLYNLPIKNIAFLNQYALSLDSNVLKIWNTRDAKLFTFVENPPETLFNDLCLVPDSGLFFIGNENTKILTYYIPSLAPAPRWCSFLDNLTEELEESKQDTVYDDYKFVTKSELHDLGLSHMLGTDSLKAYMHGYFLDVRLWRKAKEATEPFRMDEYKRKKIREKLEAQRPDRVKLEILPRVNKELALKLMDEAKLKKKKKGGDLLNDDRFGALFRDPDFQVDSNAPEYRLLNPVVTRLDEGRRKELKREEALRRAFEEVEEGSEKDSDSSSEQSSEDEKEWAREVKAQHRQLRKEREREEAVEEKQTDSLDSTRRSKLKLYELKAGLDWRDTTEAANTSNLPLAQRLENLNSVSRRSGGSKQETFYRSKPVRRANNIKHHQSKGERKRFVRPAPASFQRFKPHTARRR